MNVNANRLELLRAVKQAAAVAPNASPLEVLKGILLKAESNRCLSSAHFLLNCCSLVALDSAIHHVLILYCQS